MYALTRHHFSDYGYANMDRLSHITRRLVSFCLALVVASVLSVYSTCAASQTIEDSVQFVVQKLRQCGKSVEFLEANAMSSQSSEMRLVGSTRIQVELNRMYSFTSGHAVLRNKNHDGSIFVGTSETVHLRDLSTNIETNDSTKDLTLMRFVCTKKDCVNGNRVTEAINIREGLGYAKRRTVESYRDETVRLYVCKQYAERVVKAMSYAISPTSATRGQNAYNPLISGSRKPKVGTTRPRAEGEDKGDSDADSRRGLGR